MLRTSRYTLLLWLHCCFNILCKLYALHWKVFVKYRLCLNFLLAIQENCWRIASGTDTGEILIKQHQFGGGWGVGRLLSGPIWVDQEVWCFPAFSRFTAEEYGIVIQVGPRQHKSGAMNSNWCYFALTPWSHQGSEKSRKASGCHHLPSFHRFTLSCNMPCEGWLTVGSAVTVVEKTSLKSTPLQLVFCLYRKQRDRYKHERSVKLLTLLSPIAGLWKACSCPDAVHEVISETWCTLPVCSCDCGITRWLLPVSCYCCNGNFFPNTLLNLSCFSLSRFLLIIMDMNFSLVSLQIATF